MWEMNFASFLTCIAEGSIFVQCNQRGVQKNFVIIFCDDSMVGRLNPGFVLIDWNREKRRLKYKSQLSWRSV